MADVTRTNPSLDAATGQFADQISGLVCGEDIAAGDACYIKGADGAIYKANGTAADEKAKCAGFAPKAAKSGEPLTLYGPGARFQYDSAAGLTPGKPLFISATAGALGDAATTGGTVPVAKAITTTDIVVIALT